MEVQIIKIGLVVCLFDHFDLVSVYVQNTISRGSVDIGLDDLIKCIGLQSVFSPAL